MSTLTRPRRSCLSVPASSDKMLAKATSLGVDEVMLDLEDSVAPSVKDQARAGAVAALRAGGWAATTVAVRINDVTTPWAYRDVIAVVEQAGAHVDSVVLPKVAGADEVRWLDLLLTQIELSAGLEVGRIGIEAQIEDAAGLVRVDEIAASSARLASLVFGPADFMASLGMPSLAVGQLSPGYPGDPLHHAMARILVAARARGLAAIDGPYLGIGDTDGLRAAAARSAALGYDGKWVLHPGQVDIVNAAYTPTQAAYDRAELVLDAYERATSAAGGHRGAVMLGEEMIDEASRKLALVLAAKGRAAGLIRSERV